MWSPADVLQSSSWFSDAHNLLGAIGLLLMGAMSLIGYKVHAILFDLKLPERLASLEGTAEDHDNRLKNVEKKLFGL